MKEAVEVAGVRSGARAADAKRAMHAPCSAGRPALGSESPLFAALRALAKELVAGVPPHPPFPLFQPVSAQPGESHRVTTVACAGWGGEKGAVGAAFPALRAASVPPRSGTAGRPASLPERGWGHGGAPSLIPSLELSSSQQP